MENDMFVCDKSTRVEKIISVDMKREDFYPLNIFLNNQIEKSWVEQLKIDQISKWDRLYKRKEF